MGPRDLDVERTAAFVLDALPALGAPRGGRLRLLDAGAGDGRLAERLRSAGNEVVAIETGERSLERARAAGRDVREADLLRFGAGEPPFDAVIFARSLHHVHPLDAAVASAHALLRPGGLLLLEEFARDAIDTATARWFFGIEDLLVAGALIEPHEHDPGPSPALLRRWRERHAYHEHPLATAPQMLTAVRERFELLSTARVPYLFYYWTGRVPEDERGAALVATLMRLEAQALDAGALVPMGLRAVARRGAEG